MTVGMGIPETLQVKVTVSPSSTVMSFEDNSGIIFAVTVSRWMDERTNELLNRK